MDHVRDDQDGDPEAWCAVKYVFWVSTVLVVYAYFGYPLMLWTLSKFTRKQVAFRSIEPTVSIVMAVRNEAPRLVSKLRNLSDLDYPAGQIEVIVVSDGSTDETNEVLANSAGVRAIIRPTNRGKAAALNAAIPIATGDIVVFTDVRQEIEPSALRALVSNFADREVGCVSGELVFRGTAGSGESGVSLYWRLEKVIRKLEAATGSVVGATGALYAARRTLVPILPEGTLLDDVYIPMSVSRAGYRVVFEPSGRAWDEEPSTGGHEFRRKVRTLAGNYQLVQIAPWLLTRANPLRLRFVSHKLLRLAVPFFLMAIFLSSILLSSDNTYRAVAVLQGIFYFLAALGFMSQGRIRVASAPASFCLLNAAAATALVSFIRYRRSPTQLWSGGAGTAPVSSRRDHIVTNGSGNDSALSVEEAGISNSGGAK
jgi:cellulose synthase/poly-beta-1,6-N-acetylglucosamine synthase-like glycosyltransferase